MSIIQSKHSSASPESIKNRDYNEMNVKDLRQKIAEKSQGGRPEMVKRHKERGKLLARERIEELIDSDIVYAWYDAGAGIVGPDLNAYKAVELESFITYKHETIWEWLGLTPWYLVGNNDSVHELSNEKSKKLMKYYDEKELKEYMKWDSINIEVNLNIGSASYNVYTCDFTRDYIDINADYRN